MRAYDRLARFYDADWADFAAACLTFLSTVVDLHSAPLRIADLACGTGSLALSLAQAGHQVVGVDCSGSMLEIATKKTLGEERVQFEQCDMTRWRPTLRFDVVACMFDSINYLIDDAQLQALFSCVANALKSSGRFVFDFNRPSMYDQHCAGVVRRHIHNETLVQELDYDGDSRIARTTFRFEDGAAEIHEQRAYEPQELLPMLDDAGLEVQERFGGLDLRPLHEGCDRAILVCRHKPPSG